VSGCVPFVAYFDQWPSIPGATLRPIKSNDRVVDIPPITFERTQRVLLVVPVNC
jgi:hypothetical protein